MSPAARVFDADAHVIEPPTLWSEYLDPPLQGNRLYGDEYERIEPEDDGSLISHELGLRLVIENNELQFYRLDTGERLLTAEEAREVAEAEVERLREELKRRDEK